MTKTVAKGIVTGEEDGVLVGDEGGGDLGGTELFRTR